MQYLQMHFKRHEASSILGAMLQLRCLFVCLSLCLLSVFLSFVCRSVCCLSFCLGACLSACLSFCLSVCLSVLLRFSCCCCCCAAAAVAVGDDSIASHVSALRLSSCLRSCICRNPSSACALRVLHGRCCFFSEPSSRLSGPRIFVQAPADAS